MSWLNWWSAAGMLVWLAVGGVVWRFLHNTKALRSWVERNDTHPIHTDHLPRSVEKVVMAVLTLLLWAGWPTLLYHTVREHYRLRAEPPKDDVQTKA